MNKIINYASVGFIATVIVMTIVSLLEVWEILVEDVITKSLSTVGFLAFVCVVVVLGYRFLHPDHKQEENTANTWRPVFQTLRTMSLSTMIATAVLMGLLGILGIWEVLQEDFFWRSLSSIAIVALTASVITVVCLEREGKGVLARVVHNKHGEFSIWKGVLVVILLGWLLGMMI